MKTKFAYGKVLWGDRSLIAKPYEKSGVVPIDAVALSGILEDVLNEIGRLESEIKTLNFKLNNFRKGGSSTA